MHSSTCKQENEQIKTVYDEIFEENQVYWQVSLEEYSDSPLFGSEISSSIASAAKVYREKEVNPDKFKHKMEDSKLSSNCTFLTKKMINQEIFVSLPTYQKNVEIKIQETQKVHAVSTPLQHLSSPTCPVASREIRVLHIPLVAGKVN